MKSLRIVLFLTLAACLLPIALAFSLQDDAAGKEVWDSKCLRCHGEDGKGDTKAGKMLKVADLTTVEWKEGTSQEAVEKIIVEGIGKMPGSKGKLSPEEVTAAAHYVRNLCGKTE